MLLKRFDSKLGRLRCPVNVLSFEPWFDRQIFDFFRQQMQHGYYSEQKG